MVDGPVAWVYVWLISVGFSFSAKESVYMF